MSVLAFVGIFILIPMGMLINFVFVIPKPECRNPIAKAHGRVDLIYFILRTVLVFIGYYATTRSQLIISLIFFFVFIILHMHFEPYFDARVNNFRVAMFAIPFLSSVIANACWFSGFTNTESYAPVGMLVATIPVGFIGGWVLTEVVRRQKVRRIMQNIQTKYQLGNNDLEGGEGKGSLAQKRVLKSALVNGNLEGSRKGSRRNSARKSVVGRTIALAMGEEGKDPIVEELEDVAATMVERYGQARSKKAIQLPSVFLHPSEADIAMRFLRDSEITAGAISILHIIFQEAMEQFPKDAQLALMYSFYLSAFTEDADSTLNYLTAAKSYKPSMDVRFRVFMEERDFEQGQHATSLAASSLNVATYVEVQSMERQAVESHIESLHAMKSFWNYLAQDRMDPSLLPSYLDLMHRTQETAQKFYDKLVARYPKSKNTLRMYAKYLMVVANNAELGQELLNRADEIEIQEAREVRERAVRQSFVAQPTVPEIQEMDENMLATSNPSLHSGFAGSDMSLPEGVPDALRIASGDVIEEDLPKGDSAPIPPARASLKLPGPEGSSETMPPKVFSPNGRRSPFGDLSTSGTNFQSPGAGEFTGKAKSIASSNTSKKEFRRLKARQARLKENLLVITLVE
ncbi:hypothetical protein HDV00_012264 [Rhizophlyctis rosea]|nr:hypothetical protein HDV00_012264 [Rhizophlyctis rosea]